MKRKVVIITSLLTMTFTSCDDFFLDDCMKSTGDIISQTRNVEPFNTIVLDDNIDLNIIPSNRYYLTVTAGENLLEKIFTGKDGNTLTIKNENRCNWVRSFKHRILVDVEVINLDRINYTGSGNITCTDSIKSDLFYFENFSGAGSIQLTLECKESWMVFHTGPADLTLDGWSGVSYVYLHGNGFLNCSRLETGYTYVSNLGTNDIRVKVNSELGATVASIGNIYYSGNPYKIELEVTGDGKLIKE